MNKNCMVLFAISTIVTFVSLVALSFCYAAPCTTGAKVCDFPIDATHVCVNGVGSNSIMPNETATKNYIETSANCGLVWYVGTILTYPTGEACGTMVSPLCE
jgi:hypothetical protein